LNQSNGRPDTATLRFAPYGGRHRKRPDPSPAYHARRAATVCRIRS
jgi:hypothetical protein